jgi:cytochrome P450
MTTVPQEIAETVVDPNAYANREQIDAAFTWLRREAPLTKIQPAGYAPFWPVTKNADILEVERQSDIFHNGELSSILTDIESDRKSREASGGAPYMVRTLVQMDAPDHLAYRRLTQSALLPQNLRSLEARIRGHAREFINKMAAHDGQCDFAKDVAFLYPLRVIMELLGVPQADEPRLLKLTQEIFAGRDPDMNRGGASSPDDVNADMQQTMFELMTYFGELTEDRRNHPREDIASLIANGQINGEPLGYMEAMGYYTIVTTAGHDTTSNTIAGAMWALAENPDQFRKLKADPSLIAGHIEESVRWETPVKHFMRSAVTDVQVSGQNIAKGDWLMLCYPSGNRDESIFTEPFKYDITRSPNKHVGFGYGPHVCLGQHLARMEMRILWEELLPRLECVELNGTPARWQANFVCGPKTVPVRYKMT